MFNNTEGIEQVPLQTFVERAYLDYSMYVVLDRALPHIADGLKPVQRRIVYAMSELGLAAAAKYKKSARTVGDVLGKYHPHGDSACYEAMVLMAQPFSYRYPLIDGQGNWGSQDDPKSFAAMRYTEARLTAYAEVLLAELEQGTVAWVPNFDGTLQEPTLLPAQFPNVLLNGASGIAVGMATDIPPHNFTEVAHALLHLLQHPLASLDEICTIIPAPDFPTGSEIITSKDELKAMYAKGTGTVRLRAVYHQEDNQIIIDELPYQISGAHVVEQIAEQMQAKKLPMLTDVRDEGDHEHPNRIALELRSNRVDVDALMLHLFATTDLEHTVRVNLNMIGVNGKPQVKNLLQILQEWLAYRTETIRRRSEHRLQCLRDRLHILDGLLITFLNLDEIIAIVRYEDEPKQILMERFHLSDIQANAILDTKLRHLAKLEEQKIKAEQQSLQKEAQGLEAILESPQKLKKLLAREIEALLQRFSDNRRSQLITRTPAQVIIPAEHVQSEAIMVVLSEKGWVRMAKGHDIDPEKLNYRTGDQLLVARCGHSHQQAIFFDTTGRVYSLPTSQLPSARGQGEPLTAKLIVSSQSTGGDAKVSSTPNFIGVLMGEPAEYCLMVHNHGYGFLVALSELISKNKSGKSVMNLKEGECLLPPMLVQGNLENKTAYLCALTAQGYLLLFPLSDLPILARGRGNKVIQLPRGAEREHDTLIAVTILNAGDSLQIHAGKQKFVLKPTDWQRYVGERARRGAKLPRGLRHVSGLSVITKGEERYGEQ